MSDAVSPMESDNQTADTDFVAHVTMLNEMSKQCADEALYRASLWPQDRNTILRAVIRRLQDAITDVTDG